MDYRQSIGFFTGPSKLPHPEFLPVARRIAAEGIVLLKNENHVLPLSPQKIAVFGAGAVDFVTCGTGSGYVSTPHVVKVLEGLHNAGFETEGTSWQKRYASALKKADQKDKSITKLQRIYSGMHTILDEIPVTEEDLSACHCDTALYVIRRQAGEDYDRKAEKGDYYLSDQEEENLRKVSSYFRHTVVVLNTCVMEADFIETMPGIEAAFLIGQGGSEAGNALADVLTGKVNPSGHLTDTWAKKYEDYPSSSTFGNNDGNCDQEDYNEGIYVGYRYFDTFGVEPLYPFGYGLSYTTFTQELLSFEADWKQVKAEIRITNTGTRAGRHVVQLYVSAPEGKLDKPYQELKGYAKTKELKPEESETLTIAFPTESLSSYEEETASFVMEKGDYIIRIGNDSRDTQAMAVIHLDETAVLRKVKNHLKPDHPLQELKAPGRKPEEVHPLFTVRLNSEKCETIHGVSPEKKTVEDPAVPDATLVDVAQKKVSMPAFINSLDEDVLCRLVCGTGEETPYHVPKRAKKKYHPVKAPTSSGATTSLFTDSLGIPNWLLTDGTAGCHIALCGAVSWPVGMVIAQSWDPENARTAGQCLARELAYYHYSVLLGPALNIHRNPLCGRSFEYYAEDPVISGLTAAASTEGLQSASGISACIKHFCCNSQETNRLEENSTVSERALREIWLKGFEICVRKAQPHTLMTSYNKVNGIHTSSNRELLTDILRKEWGFEGLVMTDWGTASDKAEDLMAGNDLIMPGCDAGILKAALHGLAPEFEKDGWVKVQIIKVFGGFITKHVEHWNSFELRKDGPDTVSTTVAAKKKLNPKVREAVKNGMAEIRENPDGAKTIVYHGVNRGQTLTKEALKTSASRTLEQIMHSLSFQMMMHQ